MPGMIGLSIMEEAEVMTNLRRAMLLATSDGVPRRAFWVALFVGTVLNLINQGDVLWNGAHVSWAKLALTYLVPFAVSTHGAVSARMQPTRSDGLLNREQ